MALAELAQLLWAAQGVTGPAGQRTAPSAGALYPLRVYVAAGRVHGLEAGVHRYDPTGHALVRTGRRDLRAQLASAAGQPWIGQAPVVLLIAADRSRITARYGGRSARFVDIEVGHAAQNVHLQAVALGLGSTDVGAFDEAKVRALMGLPANEEALLLVPVGRPRS